MVWRWSWDINALITIVIFGTKSGKRVLLERFFLRISPA
jgi:hypothetical protein